MGIYERQYYHDDNIEPVRMGWNAHSVVTKIIIANVVVQLLGFILGRNFPLQEYLLLNATDLTHPLQWYRFLTYGFTHSTDIGHIFFNMLSLFFLGRAVEDKYGRHEFLRIYLSSIVLCGVAWAVFHLINGHLNYQVIGASGAVTTIAMLFVFSFPHAILRIWGIIPVQAWMVGVLIVGANLIGNINIRIGDRQQVAYDVHLIGAALAAIYFFSKLNLGSKFAAFGKFMSKTPFLGKLPIFNKGIQLHRPNREDGISLRSQREADRILEKMHREGKDSLTSREQRFLDDYSRKLRKSRSTRSHRT